MGQRWFAAARRRLVRNSISAPTRRPSPPTASSGVGLPPVGGRVAAGLTVAAGPHWANAVLSVKRGAAKSNAVPPVPAVNQPRNLSPAAVGGAGGVVGPP